MLPRGLACAWLTALFWIALSQIWSRWADALIVVKPDTVVRWHRAGFRLFWRWKSRVRTPAEGDISSEVNQLIRRMAQANPTWGVPKIHGELLKLGIVISERSVSRFISYYHRSRTHLSLGKDAPDPRAVQPPSLGEIVELPEVGGLHHRYERKAA